MSDPQLTCDHKFIDSNHCLKCGWELPVTDKRGQSEGRKLPGIPPDRCTDVRETDDPMKFVAIFPGNRVPEQPFTVSRLEAKGFNLMKRKVEGLGPDGQKAVHAARKRILTLMQRAAEIHNGRGAGSASKAVH